MVSITISLTDDVYEEIEKYSWINWSEVVRLNLIKREIFERYLKTRKITNEDWLFCEKMDWHPVDELPFKPEFIEKLKNAKKEPSIKLKSISDVFE